MEIKSSRCGFDHIETPLNNRGLKIAANIYSPIISGKEEASISVTLARNGLALNFECINLVLVAPDGSRITPEIRENQDGPFARFANLKAGTEYRLKAQ